MIFKLTRKLLSCLVLLVLLVAGVVYLILNWEEVKAWIEKAF